MRALHLTAGQAKAICGLSAPEHALQPVPLADGTFIISPSVLADTQAVTNMFRVVDGTATLNSIHILDPDDQGVAFDIIFLDANQSLGTENAAPSITDANAQTIIGRIRVGAADFVDIGGSRIATISGIGLTLKAASGTTTGYIGSITRGAATYAGGHIYLRLGLTWD